MDKKKSLIISIITVLLIVILVSGTTYAYLSSRTNGENVDTGSGMVDINYTIEPENITGNLSSSLNRDGGLKATATVSLNKNSEEALLNMYILPTALTNLNVAAFKWEVEGYSGDEIIYTNSGDFSNAIEGNPIKIVNGYSPTENNVEFHIYMWLDSKLMNTFIDRVTFGAKITADSVPLTGFY